MSSASARHPILVIAVFIVATIVAVFGALRVEAQDDVFVFLPESDPDVLRFRDVSRQFDSLRVALIGVSVRGDGDILEARPLARFAAASKRLSELEGVTRVTSLMTVSDVTTSLESAVIEPLVPAPPASAREHAALRAKILSRPLVVGSLITADARSAILLVYVRDDISSTDVVETIRPIVSEELAEFDVYFGGAPFAADAIYGDTRRDVRRLAPIAAVVLMLVVLLSFKDIVGVLLTLWTVGFGTLGVLGVMGFVGEPFTVLTSTLPVLLLASGSAYTVHVLGRYYLERESHEPAEALSIATKVVSRPVAIAAWTTIAAFLAFLVMDVRPMRSFGLAVAFGTMLCWATAITLIPAALTLLPRKPAREQLLPFGTGMWVGYQFVRRHRWAFVVGLLLIGGIATLPLPDVRARMEAQAFFQKDSEPWKAHRFFEDHFGGARFVQVIVEGDFEHPDHLRELARLVDFARSVDGVTQVQSAIDPIALTSDVLGGGRRLPASHNQAVQVYLFADGEPNFGGLLHSDHRQALVYLRVRGDAEPVVTAIEDYLGHQFRSNPGAPSSDDVSDRIGWILDSAGVDAQLDVPGVIQAAMSDPDPDGAAWVQRQATITAEFVAVEGTDALDGPDAEFFRELLAQRIDSGRREFAISAAARRTLHAAGLDPNDRALADPIELAIADLDLAAVEPAGVELGAKVTGEPMLDRALARSVQRNQLRTMVIGLATVLVLLIILFRSLLTAIICVIPAILTAVLIGGVMGALEIEIDLGTAMVGAILTDTASDFGMHYMWYLRHDDPEHVVRTVGPIMVVSSILVAVGFLVFAFASSPVLRLFGGLSGATCIVSAVLACIVVPALFRGRRGQTGK